MITEGKKVAYAGDDPFQDIGSVGRVVAMAGSGVHVMWETGPKTATLELIDINDLVERGSVGVTASGTPASTSAQYDLSLEMMGPGLQVRAALDEAGTDGLITVLAESGHLAVLADYAEEAVGLMAARIRQDPGFIDVLAQLDPEEQNTLVAKVSTQMLAECIEED